ncbi:MAG TPA: DUF72 domain-containing protein [Bacteroidota bacterium]|nr:DUF72 domain-containing protein [Bacteroidota bacterium]
MPRTVHVGCCGWSYMHEHDFADLYSHPHESKLQAYAELFDVVEINSTFYRLPRASTAEKWRAQADAINTRFEFTVKAYQGITHRYRFRGRESHEFFEQLKALCSTLKATILLFQTPASFGPTQVNIGAMQKFFEPLDRANITCVWEPRGQWYENPAHIAEVCEACNLLQCVDPFRNDLVLTQPLAYYRLHGFGKPSMYRYDFSEAELQELSARIASLPRATKHVYVFFNNVECYKNAWGFLEIVRSKRRSRGR